MTLTQARLQQTQAKQARLSQTRLKQLLDYNPETGVFTWKVAIPYSKVKAGQGAGSVNSEGYIVIKVDASHYRAHRLAWLHFYGVWPTNQIDHINGVKNDNRIVNLRDVTNQDNQSNTHKHRAGHLLGAILDKRDGKYQAQTTINGKRKYLGRYDTAIEAHVMAWIASH